MEKTWGLDIQKARGEAAMTRREARVEEERIIAEGGETEGVIILEGLTNLQAVIVTMMIDGAREITERGADQGKEQEM